MSLLHEASCAIRETVKFIVLGFTLIVVVVTAGIVVMVI